MSLYLMDSKRQCRLQETLAGEPSFLHTLKAPVEQWWPATQPVTLTEK